MSGEALRLSQIALLGEAVDCLRDIAVFVWDDDRNYVAVNEAACALAGRPRHELLGMRVGDMTPGRADREIGEVQRSPVVAGSSVVQRADGDVEIEWITCRSVVAHLPYMVSFCWRKNGR